MIEKAGFLDCARNDKNQRPHRPFQGKVGTHVNQRGQSPLVHFTSLYAMPMKVMIIRVRSIDKTASMIGMATSIA